MNTKTRIAAGVGFALALMASGASAGALDPELEALMEDMRPNERVDVIIVCADRVKRADYADEDRQAKRKKLVRALKRKANVCQRLVANGKAVAEDENERLLWLTNSVSANLRVKRIRNLAGRRGVERIYLNRVVELPEPPPEPALSGQPSPDGYTFWNLSDTRVTDLWDMGHYGLGVVVATMDTGVDPDHADLAANWRGGPGDWFDPSGEHATPYDADGHGTGVMGVILGGSSLGVNIGAAPGAQWIAAKIFDDAGQSNLARIHEAYQWMLDPDGDENTDDAPHIVNNSWVLQGTQDECIGEFSQDIALLNDAGISVVFSAGNFGPGAYSSMEPANDPGSVSVGAVDFYQDVSRSSSRGPSACGAGVYPSLVAPGESIFTTGLTGGGSNPNAWVYATGTSFAAPHLAGVMAVLKSAVPEVSATALRSAVENGAQDIAAPGIDDDTGYGYLDAVGAYLLLGEPGPTDADGDGVDDALDQCPGTPPGASVDFDGCSDSQLDGDGDGVSDALDQCPNTPAGEPVDATGCPLPPPDADGDGVSDALDQCPATPAGEAADANGCSTSQRDGDGDGVSDALDQCPNTPAGEPVDASGCPLGPVDADGDGYAVDLDCNDADPNSYPGAPEVNGDGIDQDCNGLDLTINVTRSWYQVGKDRLIVWATSDRGGQAGLRMEASLQGGGSVDRPMTWNASKSRWQKTISAFASKFGAAPVSVRIYGAEGEETQATQFR